MQADPPAPAPRLIDRQWLGMIGLAALVAVPAIFVTMAYIGAVDALTDAVWVQLPATLGLPRPVVILAIPIIGGLAVGLCLRSLPGGGGPEPAAGHGLGGDEHESLRALPGVIVASILSLVAGVSLGPEGPLVTIIGGIGSLVALRLALPTPVARLLTLSGVSSLTAGIFGSPLASGLLLAETAPLSGLELYRRIIPALAAGTVGYIILAAISGPSIHPIFDEVASAGLGDYVAAVAIGVLGGIVGTGYIEAYHRVRAWSVPLDRSPILKAAIGGAIVGLVALTAGELTLFSGEHQIYDVVDQAGTLGVSGLALLLVGKVIASLASLATGFRGGRIFPVMFMGGVLGLLVSALIPGIPSSVAVAAGIGATGVSVLRIPLFMVILAGTFTSIDLVPVILVAVVTSYAVTVGRREL